MKILYRIKTGIIKLHNHMCLIVLAYKTHPDYKLIFAANRDEFYERPSSPAVFWKEEPSLLAGKDLKAGGSWCGITRQGRFAAITNFRDLKSLRPDALSRGEIVVDFLKGVSSPALYSKALADTSDSYNGYSLVFGEVDDLFYFSNKEKKLRNIDPGIHGLSNHLLDTPWYNVETAGEGLKNIIAKRSGSITDELFNLLRDKTPAPDDKLPDTGLDRRTEKIISSVFTETETYGTRSSTVILIDNDDNVNFIEKVFDHLKKEWKTSAYEFRIIS